MTRKLKVGVIGAGFIASTAHLPTYADLDNVELVAVCDIIPERAQRAAERFGIPRVYTDYKAMLSDVQLDIVSICTPNSLHAPMTIDALAAGCNVLCEKPMATTVADAEAMWEASKKARGKLMIAYPRPFNPIVQHAKRVVDSGSLGEIYHAKAIATRRRGIPTWGAYLDKAVQGGGPLVDIGSHSLHMTLWLAGRFDAVEVLATVHNHIGRQGGYNPHGEWDPAEFTVEDSAFGMITFPDGFSVTLEASWALHTEKELGGSILFGSKGGMEVFTIGRPQSPVKIYREEAGRLVDVVPDLSQEGGKSHHYREIEFFVNECVLKGAEPLVRTEEALQVTRILSAFYESAEKGCAVKVR